MPTFKQKKAFKAVLNGSTITKAMVRAGYSKTTASTTGKLTNTKGWHELMDENFPDELLAKKHKEGLNATIKKPHLIDRDNKGKPIYEYKREEDFSTRHKYLDSAYKLKNRYPKDGDGVEQLKSVVAVQIIINGDNPKNRTDAKTVSSS